MLGPVTILITKNGQPISGRDKDHSKQEVNKSKMSSSKNSNDKNLPERFPKNVKGDFYVENQVCIACGAPEAEAPDLIDHSKQDYGHCFFKKQPQTSDELDRAINAMHVSCIAGIRYAGKDENILMRLYELGLEKDCDYMPSEIYKYGIRNKVTFQYDGSIEELYNYLIKEIHSPTENIETDIFDFRTNNKDFFEFIFRPGHALTGTQFVCDFYPADRCRIELRRERECILISTIRNGENLKNILNSDQRVTDIVWYNLEGEIYSKE